MDWLFTKGNRICHVRVAGLLIRGNKIFVQKEVASGEYALAGGHLKFGETTEEALIREYWEEVGIKIRCKRLLWTEELFWDWNGKGAHCISFYYQIELCEGAVIPDGFVPLKDNSKVACGWVSVEDLNNINIYPQFLKEEIKDLTGHPKHFVRRE